MHKKNFTQNLVFPLIWSVILYFFVKATIPVGTIQSIRLTQYFAFSAVVVLYFSLLVQGLFLLNPKQKLISKIHSFQSITVFSSLLFGLIHGTFAFFTQLGGVAGLSFLSGRFLYAIILSTTSLILLFVLQFKFVQKLFLLIGGFALVHAFLIGTHFSDFNSPIVKITFVVVATTLFIYALVLDKFLTKKFSKLPTLGFSTVFVVVLLTIVYVRFLGSETSGNNNLSIHSEHLRQAQNLQNQGSGQEQKRFSVDFDFEENIKPGVQTEIKIKIFDASTGILQENFDLFSEKLMHLIVIDSNLEFFSHLHPEFKNGGFSIKTTFPKNGRYHLYADFQPSGNSEQQFATSLVLGQESPKKVWQKDEKLVKNFGKFQISLVQGTQILNFMIKNSNGREVTTLKPYLGSFGHLVMINAATHEYIHVHPLTPATTENGGPNVIFSPVGLYGPIMPGVYRLFAQFSPDGELITTDFTIEIK